MITFSARLLKVMQKGAAMEAEKHLVNAMCLICGSYDFNERF